MFVSVPVWPGEYKSDQATKATNERKFIVYNLFVAKAIEFALSLSSLYSI